MICRRDAISRSTTVPSPSKTGTWELIVTPSGVGHPLSECTIARNSINADMLTLRQAWMAGMLQRDFRVPDTALMGQVIQRVSFFASGPIPPDPAWQTPNTVALARTIYDERQWDLLPLLDVNREEDPGRLGLTERQVVVDRGPLEPDQEHVLQPLAERRAELLPGHHRDLDQPRPPEVSG